MYYSRPPRLTRKSPITADYDEDFDYEDEDTEIVFNPIVFDEEPIDTGLVSQDGSPIYRTDRQPIGFLAVHDEEDAL